MIQIDPDDTELKNAIMLVEIAKKTYERADKDWNRAEPSMYVFMHQHNAWSKAKTAYESTLVNLALIFMERL
jgi:hypothetical protein